jgi:hypothetical protein
MHDETNRTSSHNNDLVQFQIKNSKIMMLSSFKKSLKFERCCYGLNLDRLLDKIGAALTMLHVQIRVFHNKPYKLVVNPKN